MAVHKVCGIETEYGIVLRGPGESNPVTASSLLINAYVGDLRAVGRGRARRSAGTSRTRCPATTPGASAAAAGAPPEVETHLVNAVLTNGARYYVDHAHPELSTPECADARSVVRVGPGRRADPRSGRWRRRTALLPDGPGDRRPQEQLRRQGQLLRLPRELPHGPVGAVRSDRAATPPSHFVTRQMFTGAGKVGCEAPGTSAADVPYQLTQRADFFEDEVGLETTLKRPIINTRDEPHADAQKYRRLHVIVGDANLSEVATFLKVGTTAIVLAMVEDDFLPRDFVFRSPVQAMRQVSHDLTLDRADRARRRHDGHRAGDPVGAVRPGPQVRRGARPRHGRRRRRAGWCSSTGRRCSPGSSPTRCRVADRVDWVAKYRLLDAYRERHDLAWSDARLAALALQYHDLRPAKSLARRVGLAADHRRRRGRAGDHRAARRHPGLLPGPLPAEVGRPDRGGQLGLAGVRRRRRAAAPGADDGTIAWNQGPRR